VVVQADIPYRMDEHSLQSIYTKNDAGKMVPLSAVVSLRHDHGPEIVSHLNQVNSIDLSVQAKAGYSTGDAMTAVDEVAAKVLPSGFGHQYIGMAKEEQAAGKQTVFVFALCLLFVYFLLCSQYESYILPLAVMCSIPTGVFGVFLLINLVGIENNIYVQIGLIMLIGLLAKNAILIVEFALQRRKAGLPLADAAIQAAKLRLRPILMTSLAFITGLLPLLFSSGASEQGNRSIATGAIGGMLSGIILGLIVTPVLFIIFQGLHERIFGPPKALDGINVLDTSIR
jgi:HAE1 family hydrophobic/amphiphilic exporter-1